MDNPTTDDIDVNMSRNPSAQVMLETATVSDLPVEKNPVRQESSSIVEETYARFFENKHHEDRNREAFSVLEEGEESSEFSLYHTHEVGLTQSYLDMNHGVGRIPLEADFDGKHSEFVTNYLKSKYLREVGAPIEEDDRESELARSLNKMVSSHSGGIHAVRSPREPDKSNESVRRLELATLLAKKLSSSASGPILTSKQTEHKEPRFSQLQLEITPKPAHQNPEVTTYRTQTPHLAIPQLESDFGSEKHEYGLHGQVLSKTKHKISSSATPQSQSNKKSSHRNASLAFSSSAPVDEFTIREINYLDDETNLSQRNFISDGVKTSRGPSPKKPRLADLSGPSEQIHKGHITTQTPGQNRVDSKSAKEKYEHIFAHSNRKEDMPDFMSSKKGEERLNPPRIQINLLDLSSSSVKHPHKIGPFKTEEVQKKAHSRSESEHFHTTQQQPAHPYSQQHKRQETLKHQPRTTQQNTKHITSPETLQTPVVSESICELLRKQDMVIDLLLKGQNNQQNTAPAQNPEQIVLMQLQKENEQLKSRVMQLELERAESRQYMLNMDLRLKTLEIAMLASKNQAIDHESPYRPNQTANLEVNAQLPTSFQSVLDEMKISSVRESIKQKLHSPKGNLAGVLSSKNMSRCGTNASMMQNSEKLLGTSMLDLSLSRFGLIEDLNSPKNEIYDPFATNPSQAPSRTNTQTKIALATTMFKKKASLPTNHPQTPASAHTRLQTLYNDQQIGPNNVQHSIQQRPHQTGRNHTPPTMNLDREQKNNSIGSNSKKMLSSAAVQRLAGQLSNSFARKPERMLGDAKSASFSGVSRANL